MKIGIYDKYLHTLGGGERYVASMARWLGDQGHEVEFLTHTPVELESLGRRFNISMNNLTVRVSPDLPDEILSDLTEGYDLFINGTYFSKLRNKAPKSWLILHFFPTDIYRYPVSLKKLLFICTSLLFKASLTELQYKKGFYGLEINSGVYGNWSSNVSAIEFLKPVNRISFRYKLQPNTRYQDLKLKITDSHNKVVPFEFEKDELIISTANGFNQLNLECTTKQYRADTRELGIFLYCPESQELTWRTKLLYKSLSLPKIKVIALKLLNIHLRQAQFFKSSADFVTSYDKILCNSSYGQRWFNILTKNKYESEVLYPPVGVTDFSPLPKEKLIISVGRFFVGGHNKKQLEMIEVFKKMYDKHEELKSYRYVLVGGVEDKKEHQDYLKKCRTAAKGYPIKFQVNASFSELRKSLGIAKIFWHAAGYQEDEKKDPDKFEHFGITTVEAMAAGAIPIVIAKGGQPEIIEDGVNGLLWNTEQELIYKTVALAQGRYNYDSIRKEAMDKSKQYSIDKFNERLDEILGEIL